MSNSKKSKKHKKSSKKHKEKKSEKKEEDNEKTAKDLLNDKKRSRSPSTSKSKKLKHCSPSPQLNDQDDSIKRKKSSKKGKKKRSRSRSSHHKRSSRSRSRSKEDRERRQRHRTREDQDNDCQKRSKHAIDVKDELKIDKLKLLEIAKANVIKAALLNQFNSTTGVGIDHLTASSATSTQLKAGKTIAELVDYCKKLAESKKNRENNSNNESDNDDDNDDAGNNNDGHDSPTHISHPFEIKNTDEFKLLIRQTTTTTTNEVKKEQISELSLQYPVSSGNQHRAKIIDNQQQENSVISTQQQQQQQQQQLCLNSSSTSTLTTLNSNEQTSASISNNQTQTLTLTTDLVNAADQVFAKNELELDLTALVSSRLEAIKRINKNANDFEAYQLLKEIDEKMKLWSDSKQIPGKFCGSTGVKLLQPHELEGQYTVWARKDCLSRAMPITDGIGKKLLEKMGWKQGEGLGKKKEGSLNPLALDIKTDRKGLVTNEELCLNTNNNNNNNKITIDGTSLPDGKHPVSVLIETCKLRKWRAPEFETVSEDGPAHQRTFLMRVTVNSNVYQPSVSSQNKKHAKARAALVCLQALGLVT